jgi:hypothetical protein
MNAMTAEMADVVVMAAVEAVMVAVAPVEMVVMDGKRVP